MSATFSESEIRNLLTQLRGDSAKKREIAVRDVRRKQIIDERLVLELVRLESLDPMEYVREAARFTLNQPEFREIADQSPLIIAERKKIAEQLYWPPDRTMTENILNSILKGNEDRELLRRKRKKTAQATKSLLISKAKYTGGHPLISQSREVVVSLNETSFVIYSINSQYAISALSSIPLQDILRVWTGRPKIAREIYDSDDRRTIDVFEQSPFLSITFRLKDYEYTVTFERFERNSNPQDWANKIIAQQYRQRNV